MMIFKYVTWFHRKNINDVPLCVEILDNKSFWNSFQVRGLNFYLYFCRSISFLSQEL